MQSAPTKITCWGELVWDVFDAAGETLNGSRVLGGSATALAAQLAALGAQTRLVSAVGTDRDGERAIAELIRRGVDVSGVSRGPGAATAAVDIRVSVSGEPEYSARSRLNWNAPDFRALLSQSLLGADALTFSLFAQGTCLDLDALEAALERARPAWIGCDLNLRRVVPAELLARVARHARLVKINQREYELAARSLGGRAPDTWLLGAGRVEAVAVTLGAEGSRLVTRERTFHRPGRPAPRLVDSVGAGDAFMAGLTLAALAGLPEQEALERAAARAERQLLLRGAMP